MDVVISFDQLIAVLNQPADVLIFKLFLYVGWLPLALALLWGFWQIWMYYVQGVFMSKKEFILLAIDIPGNNEQTPKAVEQMFAHLAGAHGSINLIEKYWDGKLQDTFSVELVSVDGYIQYLIRGERKYRDLMESIIYAQYPDAEITEVNDYTEGYPDNFPDDNYDIWGGEWILVGSEYLPIKTYVDFEHQFSGDFKDPFAAMMELLGSLRKGEQIWYQIVLKPIFDPGWEADAQKAISKEIGEEVAPDKNALDKILDTFLGWLGSISEAIIPLWGDITEKEEKQMDSFKIFNLKPVQRKRIDAIQEKVSKLTFEVKIRFIYMAEKEVMNKGRVNSFVGVMKQFISADLNSLKPDMAVTITTAQYINKQSRLNRRKRNIMQAYKARSIWLGRDPFHLNIEELATLWHFPVEEEAKAPMLQKVLSRKTEAPSYLPTEEKSRNFGVEIQSGEVTTGDSEREEIFSPPSSAKKSSPTESTGPPSNLPIG